MGLSDWPSQGFFNYSMMNDGFLCYAFIHVIGRKRTKDIFKADASLLLQISGLFLATWPVLSLNNGARSLLIYILKVDSLPFC